MRTTPPSPFKDLIVKAAELGERNITFTVDIPAFLLAPEQDSWRAHGLAKDILTYGRTGEEALRRLVEALEVLKP